MPIARGWGAAGIAVGLWLAVTAGGGVASASDGPGTPQTLTFGAALSLTGSLAREGVLTREGYELCREVVNGKGGVKVGVTVGGTAVCVGVMVGGIGVIVGGAIV